MHTILIVDDEKSVRESLAMVLNDDYRLLMAKDGRDALALLLHDKIDLVLLDIRMPGISGLEVLAELEKIDPLVEVIMVTATTSVDVAVESIHRGAITFVTKPFDVKELRSLIHKCLHNRDRRKTQEQVALISSPFPLFDVASMDTVVAQVAEALASKRPILIEGELGTEKEALARYLHFQTRRTEFIDIYCVSEFNAENDEQQIQEILEKQIGQESSEISIFLNRVDLLSFNAQKALLSYFQKNSEQEKSFFGCLQLISTVETDLYKEVAKGNFMEELYHYVNGSHITLPSLALRRLDLPIIIQYYLDHFNKQWGCKMTLSEEAVQLLAKSNWQGNTIELSNLIQILVLSVASHTVQVTDLPLSIILDSELVDSHKEISLAHFTRIFELQYLQKTIKLEPNLRQASRKLGITVEILKQQLATAAGNVLQ